MGIPQVLQTTERFLTNNSPAVLTALGVSGTILTAVLTGRASFKAAHILRPGEDDNPWDVPTRKEQVKKVWKLYIPPLSAAAVTVTAIVLANRIGSRRAAALAVAYSLSERAFEEYRDKVKEKFTPRKEAELRDELAQDRARRVDTDKVSLLVTEGAEVPCIDEYSKRTFLSTYEDLKAAQNDLNYKLLNHDYATLNEFYDLLRLEHIEIGNEVGWSVSKKLEITITSVMLKNNRPALSIGFNVMPVRNYHLTH